MRLLKKLLLPLLLVAIPLIFFYKSVFLLQIPFPGDLLMNSEPYRSNIAVPQKYQGSDVVFELYPWKYLSIESMKNGVFPLWNPYTFSGNPQFANLQSGALYPLNALFFILNFNIAWSAYIIIQYILLFVFSYLYLRQIKIEKVAALFGSVAFTFCGFMIVWGEYGNFGHTLLWLPFVLYTIEKILSKAKVKWFILLITGLVFSMMAGYIQIVLYIYIFCIAYITARFFSFPKQDKRIYFSIIISFLGAIGISALQLIPLYEFLSLSLRTPYSYKEIVERLVPPQNIVTLIAPDFFGNPATNNYWLAGSSILERAAFIGLWPIIFAIYAVSRNRKSFYVRFFAVSALVTYILTLNLPGIAYFHSFQIPFLSTGVPTRILCLFCFSAVMLGALGADEFLRVKKDKKPTIIALVIALIITFLIGVTFVSNDPNLIISRRNLIIPIALVCTGIIALQFKSSKVVILSVVIVLTIAELFYSFQKFNSFVPYQYLYPRVNIMVELQKVQGMYRSWGYGSAYINPNIQIIEKTFTTEGYDALYGKRYGEYISASKDGTIQKEIAHTRSGIQNGYGVNDLKNNPYRKRALDETGTKYILNKKDGKELDSAFDEKDFKLIYSKYGWQIYQNLNVLPRIALFGDYVVKKSNKAIISTLYDKDFDFHKTLVLEENLNGYNIRIDPHTKVRLVSYGANNIVLKTNSVNDQLLFVSDNYFPGWKAKVDDTEVPVYRGNYTYRVVPILKGSHKVVMYYQPNSLKYGIWISSASLVGLFLIVLLGTHRILNRNK